MPCRLHAEARAVTNGPSSSSAYGEASAALSNMYPELEHSGRTSSEHPAAAASSSRARHSSRLRSSSPSRGSIWATPTSMRGRV